MDVRPRLPKEPYTVFDVLSVSWSLVKRNLKIFLSVTLPIYLPLNALMLLIPKEILHTGNGVLGLNIYMLLLVGVQGLIALIPDLALIYCVDDVVEGRSLGFRSLMNRSLKSWPAAVGTDIIASIFLAFLFLLFIIPGVIYVVYWGFAVCAVALRKKAGMGALSYSKKLVEGRWWKTFTYSIAYLLVVLLPAFPLMFIQQNVGLGFVFDLILQTLINLIFAYYTVTWTVFFLTLEKYPKSAKPKADEQPELVINRL